MQLRVSFILLSLVLLLTTACSMGPSRTAPSAIKLSGYSHQSIQQQKWLIKQLKNQYSQWRGVKYQLGGLSKKGIDCSGFIFTTFKSRFGLQLPRSTELQSQMGENIAKNELKVGDLVFFKTSFLTRHVGVYIGNNEFLHASTSRGVTISSLSNSYWKKKYWKSKRVIS